jgi:hypothetical protein
MEWSTCESEQMVQHVHRGREQDTLIGLADTPTDDFREESWPQKMKTHQAATPASRTRCARHAPLHEKFAIL